MKTLLSFKSNLSTLINILKFESLPEICVFYSFLTKKTIQIYFINMYD